MKYLVPLFIISRFFLAFDAEPTSNVKCRDQENNEGICTTFTACEKLRKSFGGESISPLPSQLFWKSSCQKYYVCCAVEQVLPSYVSKLLEKLPQPPFCGVDESRSHNIRRRDLIENGDSSPDGLCVSRRECQRLSKIFGRGYVKKIHEDCGPQDVCCSLDTRYFNASFTRCADGNTHHSIGGNATKLDEFPWTVALQYVDSENLLKNSSRCAGSLISKRYVLTAAHCVVNTDQWTLTKVTVGEYKMGTTTDCDEYGSCTDGNDETHEIEELTVHENYNSTYKFNDIALIRLATEVNYTRFAKPICLPWTQPSHVENLSYFAAGWGRVLYRQISDTKHKVELPHVMLDKCKETLSSFGIKIGESQICAGGVKGADTCAGDSGGPLMSKANLGFYNLFGITSFGMRPCGMEGKPGVSTRVDSFLDWIAEHIRD